MAIPDGADYTKTKSAGRDSLSQDRESEPFRAVSLTEEFDQQEYEGYRRKIGELVAKAVGELTRLGQIKWKMGKRWARASIIIRVDQDCDEGLLWIANEQELDDCGDPVEELFELRRGTYSDLMDEIECAKAE